MNDSAVNYQATHTTVDENDNNTDDGDDQLEKFTVIKSPNKKMNV